MQHRGAQTSPPIAGNVRLQDVVRGIEQSTDSANALATLVTYAAHHGIEAVGMVNTARWQQLDTYSLRPQKWAQHYSEHGYASIDPVIALARRTSAPVIWHAHRPAAWFSRQQQAIYREIADFGLGGGICMPFHEPGRSSYIGLFHALKDAQELPAEIIAQLQFAALFVHEHAVRELRAAPAAAELRLTQRERDCLNWVKEGLTVPRIAARLRISESTVAFHLQNCRDKLGANTIAHAVARAITLHLIT